MLCIYTSICRIKVVCYQFLLQCSVTIFIGRIYIILYFVICDHYYAYCFLSYAVFFKCDFFSSDHSNPILGLAFVFALAFAVAFALILALAFALALALFQALVIDALYSFRHDNCYSLKVLEC